LILFYFFWQGAKLEAFCDGDWWEARVIQLDSDRVMVHYIGGDDDEDEWIPKCSERLRPSQKKGRTSGTSKSMQHNSSLLSDNDVDRSQSKDSAESRPMRRSRMLSDDARLAMQLQEEEVKVARAKFSMPQKRGRVANHTLKAESPSGTSLSSFKDSDVHVNSRTKATQGSKESHSSIKKMRCSPVKESPKNSSSTIKKETEPAAASKPSCKVSADKGRSATSPKDVKSGKQISSNSPTSCSYEDKGGMVSFFLVPEESFADTTQAVKKKRICWTEDEPVSQIVRYIVNEVLPEIAPAQIVLRAPSGMLVGHEHSLRYVRNVIWPRSRGNLVLRYGIRHESLL
jgi:hypothetical protein